MIDEPKDDRRETSPMSSPSTTVKKLQEAVESPIPAPRETAYNKIKEEKIISNKEKVVKEDKTKEKKDDKYSCWSPKEEKQLRKDKKKDKEAKLKELNDEHNLSSERIIIGGEDAMRTTAILKSHLPHEVLAQFEGKSREVSALILLTLIRVMF